MVEDVNGGSMHRCKGQSVHCSWWLDDWGNHKRRIKDLFVGAAD